MATEEHKNILQENTSEVPSDSELFAGEVRKELSEREVFVGDEDFYKLLTDSTPSTTVQQSAHERQYSPIATSQKRFSILQKVLVAGIIAIEAMLLYVLLKPTLWPSNEISTSTAYKAFPSKPMIGGSTQVAQEQLPKPESFFQPTQPMSLKVARDFYLQKDYDNAYAAYNQLYQSLPTDAEGELLRDFLQLKMALCLKRAGNFEQAERLFKKLLQSRSPVIRVVANYNLSVTEVQKKQYLKARTRAYKTIAIIGAVDLDKDWVLSLRRDCYFIVAESMTRNVLSLCNADTDLPDQLWRSPVEADPFINLDETQLRELLISGSKHLQESSLSPNIQKLGRQDVLPHWSVAAFGASVEELLARFALNAGLDISWLYDKTLVGEAMDAIRKRPVSLYLPTATAQQAIEVTAGHVGLLASFDEKGLVRISDPTFYYSLSEHVNLLIQETISLWRKYILAFHSDERIPNAHFALGLLQAQKGQVADAIAEYKLVANRFSQTSLAPYALLNSSKIKANLHDYTGARDDLTQLVEQYPDTEFYGIACLNLANTTKNAKLYKEAERLYRKVYNLGLSLELQTASALGAGRCSYEAQDYENAVKWLTKYLELAKGSPGSDFYLAYFLLGKTSLALGRPQQACTAFQLALSGPAGSLTREDYVETVSTLVETQIQLEHFVDALALLEGVHPWQFSKKESIEVLLLKGKIFRFMDLPDKAIVSLGGITEYLPESQLKTKVSFELANCYVAKGDLELAHKKLSETLISAAPGPLAHEIALVLAEVCLKLDQISQTISVCLQLLDSDISSQIKQRALKILATAYNQQKKYDNAALALFGQW